MTRPPVTFDEVMAARAFLAAYLRPSPLIQREAVSAALGLDALLKCENALPTAAFKVRGGLNLLGRDVTARGGVIAASTGNHGQSLAFAGETFGIPVTIVAPRGANPLKIAAMRAHGATIVEHGADYDEAREECERRATADGIRYVHSGNEPYLIAGVATAALEVIEERPHVDVLIVPVGGGSGAAGACIVAKHLRPNVRVIGVQADGAPAAYLTWRDRQPRDGGPVRTFAEGLATRTSFELPQRILGELLDDFILVSDESSTGRCVCSSSRDTWLPKAPAQRRRRQRGSCATTCAGNPSRSGSAAGTRPRNRSSAPWPRHRATRTYGISSGIR